MRLAFLFSLSIAVLLSAGELSFGSIQTSIKDSSPIQSLQIHSSKSLDSAVHSLKKIPENHKQYVNIYKSGEYYATRYQNKAYPKIPVWIINDFKKAKFNDSLVLYPDPNNMPIKNAISSQKTLFPNTTQANNIIKPPLVQTSTPPLNQHDQTRLILDATNAHQKHDYTQATIYYEMMIASGMKDRQILINLAYLYGREGSFGLLEKKIEGKRGINDYLYAYGVGALESGRSDLYNSLSSYLIYDKSGKLSMLCGYFFEQENNTERSNIFYKMAYNANPSDPHILYAYARSVDISGDNKQAIYLYTQLTQSGSEFESLRMVSKSRIQALRNSQ
ncbi:MAG: hypothetical protein Q8R58_11880 [Sulfuricurvum sp.]|nr:hypothetical protein [Sulfuricurvum sp.]